MLRWKLFRSRWLALAWLAFISFLFFLPGSALPKESWFTRVQVDKWAHFGVFAMLVFLWRSSFSDRSRQYSWSVVLAAIAYGMLVELIQKQWVPNRDFDMYDVLSDAAGCCLGLWIWWRAYKKNKPL